MAPGNADKNRDTKGEMWTREKTILTHPNYPDPSRPPRPILTTPTHPDYPDPSRLPRPILTTLIHPDYPDPS
ncbi:hypothetical protein Pcinc_007800 [Petrolisthes cinctipes]|uniref:Uncharacterized protein n=1 Tax=Petrolisthes cinctipes TaxID=88211 RepID=A0AAE1G7R4_PETCI|nr:hypothetical protein Pcinc_007800 [Petrolisthes cinctipes]